MIIRTKYVRVVGPGPDEKFDEKEKSDIGLVTFFDRRFVGRIGQVVGRTAKGDEAGVGDSPEDPAYRVRFAAAFGMEATEGLFWTEELEPVKVRRTTRTIAGIWSAFRIRFQRSIGWRGSSASTDAGSTPGAGRTTTSRSAASKRSEARPHVSAHAS